MPQGRRPYRLEFRQRIVELVRAGRSPRELAREFEPTAESITAWVRQADRITSERKKVQERLRRLAKAYVDGFYSDEDYHYEKRSLEMQLEGLVLPEADAAKVAGELIMRVPELWAKANLEERRKLLMSMFDAIYVDTKETKGVVAMLPKAPFRPVCSIVTARENSGVLILKQPPKDSEAGPCSWWRRGRVELPVQKRPLRMCYKLSRHFVLVLQGLCRRSPHRTN